jgi:hypothetical protein
MKRRSRWCILCRDAAPIRGDQVCLKCVSAREWDAKLLLLGWSTLWGGVLVWPYLLGR